MSMKGIPTTSRIINYIFLALSMLGNKFSAHDILKYFPFFPRKNGFDSSLEDNLHEMSKPVSGKK